MGTPPRHSRAGGNDEDDANPVNHFPRSHAPARERGIDAGKATEYVIDPLPLEAQNTPLDADVHIFAPYKVVKPYIPAGYVEVGILFHSQNRRRAIE